MHSLTFAKRILFLSQSPSAVAAQLAGHQLDLHAALPLRDDVSTDEITPVAILSHFDDKLGRFVYAGYQCEPLAKHLPIAPQAVRSGGFEVTVAGKRYGKGSSREHSPLAEKLAGIRLVVAESFERIYRQNADNIGLFTSTNFGLIERIQSGQALELDELLEGRDDLAKAILKAGGLLGYGQQHLRGLQTMPMPAQTPPQTLFEKIVTRHQLQTPATDGLPQVGQGCFVRADLRFIHEYYTGMCAHALQGRFGPGYALHDPQSIVVFEDHTSYVEQSPAHLANGLVANVHAMCQAQRNFVQAHGLRLHRTLTEQEAAQDDGRHVAGISHAMVAEHDALPGQVVVGTDSHTPHSGALGCVAFGVGTTDMANAFVTGAVRLTLPQSLKVQLHGKLPAGTSAKDLVLHLLALPSIRAGAGVGKVFEFCGSAVQAMNTDERATLTNMTAELGGLTGIVAPDAETQRFLKDRRGIDFAIEPWMHSDADAPYADVIELDCTNISPMVAQPGDPGLGLPLASLQWQERPRLNIAYGGSCTAGKREDFEQYHGVLRWAANRGLRAAPGVALYLQFATTAVRDFCAAKGYNQAFEQVGAQLLQPSCGACANCGPGSSTKADQVTVSAINRNFPGRSGPGQVWLASPATVAASAIAGRLASFEELQSLYASDPPLGFPA